MTPTAPVTVALFSGSLRDGSTNSAALRTAVDVAGESVRVSQYTGMAALPHFNPDDDTASPHPEVARLRALIDTSDALLFCTPEYAGSLPGSFKNLLDWTIGGVETQDKAARWINVSASVTRAESAHITLRNVLRYTGVRLVDDACVHTPVSRATISPETGTVTDTAARTAIADAVQALARQATVGTLA